MTMVVHLSITEDRAEVITIDDAESVIAETKPKGQVTMMVAEHVSTPSTSTSTSLRSTLQSLPTQPLSSSFINENSGYQ